MAKADNLGFGRLAVVLFSFEAEFILWVGEGLEGFLSFHVICYRVG
jgi:hypothetical protein